MAAYRARAAWTRRTACRSCSAASRASSAWSARARDGRAARRADTELLERARAAERRGRRDHRSAAPEPKAPPRAAAGAAAAAAPRRRPRCACAPRRSTASCPRSARWSSPRASCARGRRRAARPRRSSRPGSTAWSAWSASCSAARSRCAPRRCCACSSALPRARARARAPARQARRGGARGAELELDRAILDRLGDPLVHLVRNAVDHGIEAPEARRGRGQARRRAASLIDARREQDHDPHLGRRRRRRHRPRRGARRAVEAGVLHPDLAADLPPEDVAGARVPRRALDAATRLRHLRARRRHGRGEGHRRGARRPRRARSRSGRGTTTTLVVPITAAVQRVLLVGLGEEHVASRSRRSSASSRPSRAHRAAGRESFALVDGEPLLVLDLAERLGLAPRPRGRGRPARARRGARAARRLPVERLAGQQEIYVKPVPRLLASARALAGMTVLGDGRPVFVLDLNQIA